MENKKSDLFETPIIDYVYYQDTERQATKRNFILQAHFKYALKRVIFLILIILCSVVK